MGKPLNIFLLALLCFCFLSCKRHVCPTYYSAFNIEKGGPEKFFNYFLADTAQSPVAKKDSVANNHRLLAFEQGETPMNDRMFYAPAANKNGLVKKKPNILAWFFPKKEQEFMKVVRAKVSFSEIDSTDAAELYAVQDSLFSHDRFKRDQYIYMKLIGFEILDSMQAQQEREQARLDTLQESSLSKKEQRKLRRERRREYRRLKKAAKRGEIEQSEADAYYEEYIAKPKRERKEKRKGEKEEEEEANKEEEEDDVFDIPGLEPDAAPDVSEEKEEGKKKKRKRGKKEKKSKDPPDKKEKEE